METEKSDKFTQTQGNYRQKERSSSTLKLLNFVLSRCHTNWYRLNCKEVSSCLSYKEKLVERTSDQFIVNFGVK